MSLEYVYAPPWSGGPTPSRLWLYEVIHWWLRHASHAGHTARVGCLLIRPVLKRGRLMLVCCRDVTEIVERGSYKHGAPFCFRFSVQLLRLE